MRVAIVGGTGSFGRALAARLHAAGEDVLVGSRDRARGLEAAAELGLTGGTNEEIVAGADLVVLAVKADAAVETALELAHALGATPLLCVASELRFAKDGVRPGASPRSVAERVDEIVGGHVAAGLHSIAAQNLGEDDPPDEDALVCGDDEEAKRLALEVAGKVVRGQALDGGPLATARVLEGLTAVIVNVNRRYGAHAGLRVTGLP